MFSILELMQQAIEVQQAQQRLILEQLQAVAAQQQAQAEPSAPSGGPAAPPTNVQLMHLMLLAKAVGAGGYRGPTPASAGTQATQIALDGGYTPRM
jgi:hypothetical protein